MIVFQAGENSGCIPQPIKERRVVYLYIYFIAYKTFNSINLLDAVDVDGISMSVISVSVVGQKKAHYIKDMTVFVILFVMHCAIILN